jgi:4'-phosphopantetheinyl transferase
MPTVDVDLRLVDLTAADDAVARAESSLTAAEVARARRGTPAVHRRRVLLRAALRAALAPDLDVDPQNVPLATTAAGRPYVAVAGTRLDVSCSASAGLGLVAIVRDQRVGIDVERIVAWSDGVLDEGWLANDERRALGALPPAARAEAATRAWTRKEAVLKARGTGLLVDPATVTPIAQPADVLGFWAVDDVAVPAGWVASIALGRREETPA